MLTLNATLDNLIAMVVVLLALSLVVQAVQSGLKKAFKLKSRQIEDSLAHLFQFILYNKTSARTAGAHTNGVDIWAGKWNGLKGMFTQSPFLRIFFRWLPHPGADSNFPEATVLYNEVLNGFRSIGRTALSTRPMFDSISKSDVLKVV